MKTFVLRGMPITHIPPSLPEMRDCDNVHFPLKLTNMFEEEEVLINPEAYLGECLFNFGKQRCPWGR